MICIGVDIGATYTKLGLVDTQKASILAQDRFATTDFSTEADYIQALVGHIRELDPAAKHIGIGAPNANFRSGKIVKAANLPWKKDFPLAQMLSEQLKTTVKLDNDANVAALGEGHFGAARGMKDFIVITLGTGLGSGIVIDGKLLHGHTGQAGELGHLHFGSEGRLSGYQREDAAETYLSATGLVRTYLSLSVKASPFRQPKEEVTAQKVAQWAEEGDAIAARALSLTGRWLGNFLSEVVLFSSPEAIFLTGGLTQAGKPLLKAAQQSFQEALLPPFQGSVRLAYSALAPGQAALLGAAALALEGLA